MRRETVWYVALFLVFLSAFALPIAPGHAETDVRYVQSSRANVRTRPAIEPNNILDTLERGTEVTVLRQAEDWYEVVSRRYRRGRDREGHDDDNSGEDGAAHG